MFKAVLVFNDAINLVVDEFDKIFHNGETYENEAVLNFVGGLKGDICFSGPSMNCLINPDNLRSIHITKIK